MNAEKKRNIRTEHVTLGGQENVLRLILSTQNPARHRIVQAMRSKKHPFDQHYEIPKQVPEMRIIMDRNFRVDNALDIRCAHFVFQMINGERWKIGGLVDADDEYEAFWTDTFAFVRKKGYRLVNNAPQCGDVIVYGNGFDDDSNQVNPLHFGVYQGGKLVHSKLSCGPVFAHPLTYVHLHYGNDAVFLRKEKNKTPTNASEG